MLDFSYDRSGDDERAEYRGLTIKAVRDQSPSNPLDDYDSEPPLVILYDRRLQEYGDGALEPIAEMSPHWISRHWRAIAKILDIAESDMERDAKARGSGYPMADFRRDQFEQTLSDMRPGSYGGGRAYFEAIAALWELRGIAAHVFTSRGYSQGDYAEGIAVATPEWSERVGAPKESHLEQLKGAAALYGAWAWGDVYGFVIESPDGDHLDSCWGFYGLDHNESGLADAAQSAADYIADSAKRRRSAKLAEIIKARVPLDKRAAILAASGEYRSAI